MKLSRSILIAVIIFLLWLVLAWAIGPALHLHGPNLLVVRIGLTVIGIIGLIAFLVWHQGNETASPQDAVLSDSDGLDSDYIFQEAAERLRKSSASGVRDLRLLPAVFILGDAGAAKTSVIAHSGLEPELLAGHAYKDNLVVPTKSLNLWVSKYALLVDPAGKSLSNEHSRRRLFRKFGPVGLGNVLRGGSLPPRCVLLAVDAETFLQQGAAEALSVKARHYQAILGELSQELGTTFPVYVLFTKADRLPYFREFAETLAESEVAEVFGVTLPVQMSGGVYAEEQSKRTTYAFRQLYHSLAEKRTILLARENDAGKLPNIYEFPREFAKIRPLLVQFLVDTFRPSQLRVNPVLRGFYFTGVRPVVIGDVVSAAISERMQAAPVAQEAGATRMFMRQSGVPVVDVPQQQASRRIPQWVFLRHLFSDVILVDHGALGLSVTSVKIGFWRRALLASAAAMALVLAAIWTMSFLLNRSLVSDAIESARQVPQAFAQNEIPTLDSLERLERMRQTVSRLDGYEREGAPLSLRWGLYTGTEVLPPLRVVYYDAFHRMLLAPAQVTLTALCSNPPKSNDISNYRTVYDALKAYLITTDHHEKSTRDFLAPVLTRTWAQGRPVDNQRLALAQKQFELYADELTAANPFPHFSKPEEDAVDTARAYLNQFGYEQRVYQVMLADAAQGNHPIVFNQMFPGSAEAVVNGYRVEGAFSKAGYTAFDRELQNPNKYLAGEEWVLGPSSNVPSNRSELAESIRKLYRDDFVKAWRGYIKATSVVPYRSLQDASNKLERMVGNQSPLLAVLCVASTNTAVPDKSIADLFQPPQMVAPPGCLDRLPSPANAPYLDALTRLQGSISQVAANISNEPAKTQAIGDAAQADAAVLQIGRGFTTDREAGIDGKTSAVLRAPIEYVKRLVQGLGPAEVNGAARTLCAQLQPVLMKYPFSPRSGIDATLSEVSAAFRQPDGLLWTAYAQNFQKLMVRQGNYWVSVPGQNVTLRTPFLGWFGRAASVSEGLFRSGNPSPSFTFAIRPVLSDDVESVTLEVDGQTATFTKANVNAQQFAWPGSTPDLKLQVRFVGGSAFNFPTGQGGLWAVFRWLDIAEHWQPQGSGYIFENTLRTVAGPATIPSNGHVATVRFMLDPMGSPIRPGYFNSLSPCVASAVQ